MKRGRVDPKSACLCAFAVSLALMLAGLATPASAADGTALDLSQINRKLSALASEAPPSGRVDVPAADVNGGRTKALPAISVRRADPQAPGSFVPAKLLKIAQQVRGADRLMHFRSHGIDANLWGVLNRGRGVSVQYSVKF